jgi:hypothetical protein
MSARLSIADFAGGEATIRDALDTVIALRRSADYSPEQGAEAASSASATTQPPPCLPGHVRSSPIATEISSVG